AGFFAPAFGPKRTSENVSGTTVQRLTPATGRDKVPQKASINFIAIRRMKARFAWHDLVPAHVEQRLTQAKPRPLRATSFLSLAMLARPSRCILRHALDSLLALSWTVLASRMAASVAVLGVTQFAIIPTSRKR